VELGLPGVKTEWAWIKKGLCDMRSPPGALVGFGEARSVELGGGGGSAWRCIAGVRCSKGSRGYSLQVLAPKGSGRATGAHRGLDWMDARRSSAGGEVERRRTGGAWGPGRWRAPPVVWAPQEGAPSSCEHEPRVSEARGSPAVRNRHGGWGLTSGWCRSDSGAVGA
jgi:hypothetical protein